ncbi:hypothetical protein [Saccharopolyspora shandongensis]|uniref:hypothetical protein n=1 Tax=Saccharopolyspora shandongensis TaxID=418495 RepID=UPI0033F0FB08
MGYDAAPPPDELEPLLSAERLGTYHRHAPAWGVPPISLYLLGGELAASFHRDLGVAEVVLRNALNDQLTERYGPRWWADEQLLDDRGQAAIAKAWTDARCTEDGSSGRLVAQLAMGFWVHLLEPAATSARSRSGGVGTTTRRCGGRPCGLPSQTRQESALRCMRWRIGSMPCATGSPTASRSSVGSAFPARRFGVARLRSTTTS